MSTLLRLLTRVPLPLLYTWGWLLYFVAFRITRWRRDDTERDIANAFPGKARPSAPTSFGVPIAILPIRSSNRSGGTARAQMRSDDASHSKTGARDAEFAAGQSVVLRPRTWQLGVAVAGGRRPFRDGDRRRLSAATRRRLRRVSARARSRFGGRLIPRKDLFTTS